jgi:hypothetical protein
MKKSLICIGILFLVNGSYSYASAVNKQTSEPERLMTLFLDIVRTSDQSQIENFIKENYSEGFLRFPIEGHLKVINDLHKKFSSHSIIEKRVNGTSITVLIKSPVNKTKEITIETDGKKPSKITLINIRRD